MPKTNAPSTVFNYTTVKKVKKPPPPHTTTTIKRSVRKGDGARKRLPPVTMSLLNVLDRDGEYTERYADYAATLDEPSFGLNSASVESINAFEKAEAFERLYYGTAADGSDARNRDNAAFTPSRAFIVRITVSSERPATGGKDTLALTVKTRCRDPVLLGDFVAFKLYLLVSYVYRTVAGHYRNHGLTKTPVFIITCRYNSLWYRQLKNMFTHLENNYMVQLVAKYKCNFIF